ncbi:6449_t:CDS:2, partial [Diversispora eburnea]
LSNLTTVQKREITEDNNGTLRITSRNLSRCGGTIVFTSFEAIIIKNNTMTYFLKGNIPGDLSQSTAQSSINGVYTDRVTCYYAPRTPTPSISGYSCIIDSGSVTFYYGYDVAAASGVRVAWKTSPEEETKVLTMSFSLWSSDSVIRGCVNGSANPISNTSIPIPSIAYNGLFISGVIVGLISGFTSYTLIKGSNISPISNVEKLAVGLSQPPSVYDIFRVAQFFVTTALLSLTHLPDSYRDLVSEFSWTIGLPSFSESLSNVADNQIRKGICNMSNPPSSGFITTGRKINIPDYNLFFCVIIEFSIVLAIVLVIALLLGLLSRFWKFLQKKWSIVKTASCNIHFLVLENDRDAFNAPVHTFIYGALYTQYRDHSEEKQTCLWFFVFTFAYDIIRAIATGGARQSGVLQTSYRFLSL